LFVGGQFGIRTARGRSLPIFTSIHLFYYEEQVMEGLHNSVAEGQSRQAEVERVKKLVMEAVGGEIEKIKIAELFVSKKDFGGGHFRKASHLLALWKSSGQARIYGG
jgi:hypothetical protein